METEVLAKLYLELSQFNLGKTRQEMELEQKLLKAHSADFYRKMRFCSALFPGESGTAHAQKSWHDVFEEFKRRLGITEGGPDGGFIAKASEFEDKVSGGNYVASDE